MGKFWLIHGTLFRSFLHALFMLQGLVIAGNDGLSFPEGPQRERWPGDASNSFASTN